MKSESFRGICLVLLVAVMTIRFKELVNPFGALMWVVTNSIPYFAILFVFSLFLYCDQAFQSGSLCLSKISFVGKRTLDIYFIHYFFLPSMPYMSIWCSDNLLLQFLLGTAVTIPVMAISLFIGELIRMSPFTSKFLLGVKKKQNSE